jgi:hypothetical protein
VLSTPQDPAEASFWASAVGRGFNLLLFVPLIVGNGLAGAGGLSGESIGVIANRWPTFLLPANWAFGIWSLIYLLLLVYLVFQVLPGAESTSAARRIGWRWAASVGLNLAWIITFSFSRFGLSLLAMVGLLAVLIGVFVELETAPERDGLRTRSLVQIPFSLYLGWISVALIVNVAQYLTVLGWDGSPLAAESWAAIMSVVAGCLGVAFVIAFREWVVPLVVAWAMIAIAARYPDVEVVAWTARGVAAVCLVAGLAGMALRRRSRTATPAA